MIDVVIPLGTGSVWQNTELRYCLRSIEKHLKGYGKIIIVGEFPSWLKECYHIPVKDNEAYAVKAKNIFNKIIKSFEKSTDTIIFFNDDHFLLQDVQAADFPYHHKGTLAEGKQSTTYQKFKDNTRELLESLGKEIYNFDTHCPIVYEKSKFLELKQFDFNKPYCYVIKSLYCNFNGITGEYFKDCKINERLSKEQVLNAINNRHYFSMGENGISKGLLDVLEELYPNKSKYEK